VDGNQKQEEGQVSGGAEEEKKPKKKVNFNLPFIISGLIVGLLAAAPYTQLVNYFYGVWGFLGGILAAFFLSRSFKYLNYAQAAVLGMLSGIVAVVVTVGVSLILCFINFDTKDLYPNFINDTLIPIFEKAQMEQVKGKIILPPWEIVKELANESGQSPISDWIVLHILYLIGTIICMAILGGFIGGLLFCKPPPKKKVVRVVKRRLPAAAKKQQGEKADDEKEQEGGPEKGESGGEEPTEEGGGEAQAEQESGETPSS